MIDENRYSRKFKTKEPLKKMKQLEVHKRREKHKLNKQDYREC